MTETSPTKRDDPPPMTPAEFEAAGRAIFGREWRKRYVWRAPFARALGLSTDSLRAYLRGRPIPPPVAVAVRCLRDHQPGEEPRSSSTRPYRDRMQTEP